MGNKLTSGEISPQGVLITFKIWLISFKIFYNNLERENNKDLSNCQNDKFKKNIFLLCAFDNKEKRKIVKVCSKKGIQYYESLVYVRWCYEIAP